MTVTSSDIAYIIFTSGSTGIPKAVQVRHKNFTEFMCSLVYGDVVNESDTVLQLARCSFDVHVQDIMGSFMIGSSLIMLHPRGIMDFNYLSGVFKDKNITCITTVPTIINSFFTFLQQQNHQNVAQYLRSICSGGEPCSLKLINLMSNTVIHTCRLWNMYGPAETTIDCTFHLLDDKMEPESFPIGRPLSNYQNLVLDQVSQRVSINQEAELFVEGAGVFAGYLGRDDLTAKALVEIDGQLFYRTGDLVRMDNNGLLHYQGRKDHQIKLHGQRIELGEIERCLLNIISISVCVVMKWKDDYLAAYVQSFDINEEELREHCQSHLPPHMIPSIFIILEKLPLNQNGKIDRKQLPSPDFSSSTLVSSDKSDIPLNQFEERINTIWCQVLHSNQNHISRTTSFFSVGGHSLRFIELYYRYQALFSFDAYTLSISLFLQQPTIFQHAQLLQALPSNDMQTTRWQLLHTNQDITSIAQKDIFLDEQVQISHEIATYSNFFEHPFVVINESCDNILFILPPGDGGAESYLNNIVPPEIAIDCTVYRANVKNDAQSVSVGGPFFNYRCIVMNQYLQSSVTNQEVELLVGGVSIFAGYLSRDDSTAKALLEIDRELFYQTSDFIKTGKKGYIHYITRKDFQTKLRGQPIELGGIEQCLLRASISSCVVIKWNDDYLVAYVQFSHTNEEELSQRCQSHLPPHMVPSIFIILDKLPLNTNGKIDRKLLPLPDFLSSGTGCDTFHVESPPIDVPFGQLGGTSLDTIHALTLIRQQVHTNIDIGLLFANPSIRQLAIAVEPLLISNQSQETVFTVNQSHETYVHLAHSFVVESIGVIVLVCQWLCSIIIIHRWCPFLFQILPVFHLLFYVICSRLFSPRYIKTDNLFSCNYYRWWFLDRLWNNNTFWLQHILGTPLYSYYLRLCGARISLNTHIYTTTIDAPWLLEIDEGSWIANETCLNCLYFNDDNTFKLSPIRIGSNCSIGTRSVLFDGVDMQNNIIVQPMSSVTGFVASETIIDGEQHKSLLSDTSNMHSNRSLSIWHKIYQIIVIISIICIHCALLILVYKVYSVGQIPLLINIAFCWTLWSIIGCFISLLLLKFIVRPCAAGEIYPIASRLYLQKIWLRQLIVSSFHHAWLLSTTYDYLYPYVLRWLGAHIEENVKIAEIDTFLSCPTNLLKFEMGVTTFGGVSIVPTDLTFSGDHRVDQIVLGSHTNLANGCSILPGSCLAPETMIGNLTRVSRETKSKFREVLMGVPARTMPFQMPVTPKNQDQIKIIPFWHSCLSHYVSKCLLLSIYSFGGLVGGSIIHIMLVCGLNRCRSNKRHEIVQQIIERMSQDYAQFICPFLGNTQWLIRLFRAYGAHIGENTIMPDISSITDYPLMSIGDNVRLNAGTQIQGHSFEQRIFKLAPVSIGNSCVLMSSSIVMAGCELMGNNRLYPLTLIMKNDQLSLNTDWKGLPARSYTVKARLSRSTIVHDDLVKYQQGYDTINKLFLWYERIASVYTSINELQFMNYGYADMDEYIDDHTGYYSRKLYEQVLANATLTNQNILEINCGRGAGAAWCVHTHASHSYTGIDPSQDVINLCQRLYSTPPRLSFVVANATKHLPFENESIDIILCIQATHAFGEPIAITQFANEVVRVLRPNGYLLWCDFCYMNGSSTSVYDLIGNDELIIEEKINITKNVLHALDIQNKSRTDFIQRYIQPEEQEHFRQFAGLPGTQIYEDMSEGRSQYWRVVFRKKTITDMPII
ncbi:unnamed protein product [Adineta steineri]|uniref:Carrier domain-containing protein n=2 Tax=Adineta steineri TaxID=433720 RepID=A0A815KPA9_9BILA|nr:unnamed protein product [Adineta steineri]CAF1409842.1 unnamed protein product [Adineta steineri]